MNVATYREIISDPRSRLAGLPADVLEFEIERYLCEYCVIHPGEHFSITLFGVPHSPARIEAGSVIRDPSRKAGKLCWWRYGQLHREGAPAVVELEYYSHRHVQHIGNVVHVFTSYEPLERWYLNGQRMLGPGEPPEELTNMRIGGKGDGWDYKDSEI